MQDKISAIVHDDILKIMSKQLGQALTKHGFDSPDTRQVIWFWLADAVALNPKTARLTWQYLKGPSAAQDKREKLSFVVHCLRPMPPVIRTLMREAGLDPVFLDVTRLVCQSLILD